LEWHFVTFCISMNDVATVGLTSRFFRKSFNCRYNPSPRFLCHFAAVNRKLWAQWLNFQNTKVCLLWKKTN